MTRHFIFITLSLFCLSTSSLAQIDSEKLNEYLDSLYLNNKFMGSVAVSQNGDLLYSRALGSFNPEKEGSHRVDTETVYRIGSITKTFTATMILQLVEEGKLSLQSKLAEYFPKVCNADTITIEHLLRHQSGIFNFTNDPGFFSYKTKGKSREEMLDMINELSCIFTPGSTSQYSNTNYVLLGYLLEAIDGKPYSEILEERIVDPAGLKRTYYGGPINRARNEISSFSWNGSQWQKQTMSDMFVPGGAGAIASTAIDITQFLHLLFKGHFLSTASLAKMKDIESDKFGMGLFYYPFREKHAYGHNGGIDGFSSTAAYFPEEEVCMAIISNGLNYDLNNMAIAILNIVFNHPVDIPSFNMKPSNAIELLAYEGLYASESFPLKISVFVNDNALYAQATGQASFQLENAGDDNFRYDGAGIKLTFTRDEEGKVTGFEFYQRGAEIMFSKVQE